MVLHRRNGGLMFLKRRSSIGLVAMAVKFRDYYEVLGVSKTEAEDETKQAYRRLPC